MAPSRPTVERLTTVEIADEIWQEVARHNAGAPVAAFTPPGGVRPAVLLGSPRSLHALLELDGLEFVAAAYSTLLGRFPDDAGTQHVLNQLNRGVTKIELLGQLQRSREGRSGGRALPGLGRRYLVRRLSRLPLLGLLVRLAAKASRGLGLSRRLGGKPKASAIAMEALGLALNGRMDELQAQLSSLSLQIGNLGERLAQDATVRDRSTRKAAADVGTLATRLAGLEESLGDATLALADRLDGLEPLLALHDEDWIAARIDAAGRGVRHEVAERVTAAEALVQRNRADVADQQRRIGLILDAMRRREPAAAMPADHTLDPLYLAFEDRFRGSRDDIRTRQRVYLPVLAESGAGHADRPILDIGCGRGEFLALMRDESLHAAGVDSNEAMAAACRDAGLDVAAGDALDHLASLPDGALGAVTGFHIIEHLPFAVFVRLLDEVLRVLAPGGVVVFETPNPANVLTASRWFWLDPTHRHPLPGEMVAMVVEARGFHRVSILELHPSATRFEGDDPVLLRQLDALFHGPQDYALIARKP